MTVKSRVSPTWGKNHGHSHRPYLLVESSDPTLALSDFSEFKLAGFDVAHCTGPGPEGGCPLQEGLPCSLVDRADIVLHLLDPATGIARAAHVSRPDLPVVVVGPAGSGADLPPDAPVPSQIRALLHKLDRAG